MPNQMAVMDDPVNFPLQSPQSNQNMIDPTLRAEDAGDLGNIGPNPRSGVGGMSSNSWKERPGRDEMRPKETQSGSAELHRSQHLSAAFRHLYY
jgi:hypothetical protein